jgi:hypothetical protein
MRKYEYCLDTCPLYVSGDTYIRGETFGWMEMGIVVKIHVPIHSPVAGGNCQWIRYSRIESYQSLCQLQCNIVMDT